MMRVLCLAAVCLWQCTAAAALDVCTGDREPRIVAQENYGEVLGPLNFGKGVSLRFTIIVKSYTNNARIGVFYNGSPEDTILVALHGMSGHPFVRVGTGSVVRSRVAVPLNQRMTLQVDVQEGTGRTVMYLLPASATLRDEHIVAQGVTGPPTYAFRSNNAVGRPVLERPGRTTALDGRVQYFNVRACSIGSVHPCGYEYKWGQVWFRQYPASERLWDTLHRDTAGYTVRVIAAVPDAAHHRHFFFFKNVHNEAVHVASNVNHGGLQVRFGHTFVEDPTHVRYGQEMYVELSWRARDSNTVTVTLRVNGELRKSFVANKLRSDLKNNYVAPGVTGPRSFVHDFKMYECEPLP